MNINDINKFLRDNKYNVAPPVWKELFVPKPGDILCWGIIFANDRADINCGMFVVTGCTNGYVDVDRLYKATTKPKIPISQVDGDSFLWLRKRVKPTFLIKNNE